MLGPAQRLLQRSAETVSDTARRTEAGDDKKTTENDRAAFIDYYANHHATTGEYA